MHVCRNVFVRQCTLFGTVRRYYYIIYILSRNRCSCPVVNFTSRNEQICIVFFADTGVTATQKRRRGQQIYVINGGPSERTKYTRRDVLFVAITKRV